MSDRDVTRTRYLNALQETYGTLRLPIRSGEQFLPLQAVFQPLRLSNGSFAFDGDGKEDVTTARNGTEALAKSKLSRMVVLGGPGMGKTTLLKELLLQAIQAALIDAQAPLPLFISLPDLARSGLTLPEYLPAIFTKLEIHTGYIETLIKTIEQGQAFLCLDSLDEVVPAQRPDIIALIDREAARCGGIWIIGSRFTEYKGGQFVRGQFAEWELQPLDEKMRLELAKHLLPIIATLLQRPAAPNVEDFLKALNGDTRIAAWSTNPLLFSLAAIVYTQAGMLPACRSSLYRDCIEIMLANRAPAERERAELRTLLADSALQLYQTRGRNFTVSELFELLSTLYPDATFQAHTNMVARMLDAGLLDVVAHETYGFKHQMFQEYLAAVALATQLTSQHEAERASAWEFAWRKHTYSRWGEILRLCVGVLVQEHDAEGSQVAIRWLLRLIAEGETPAGDVGNLCLELALGSLREFSSVPMNSELAKVAQQLILTWAKLRVEQHNHRIQRLAEDVRMLDLHLVLPAIAWLEDVRDHEYQGSESEHISTIITDLFHKQDAVVPASVLIHAYPNPQGINLYACTLPATLQAHAALTHIINLLQDKEEHLKIRLSAVHLLEGWEKQAPIEVFCQILEDASNHPKLRIAVAEALGKQEELAPIEVFCQILEDTTNHPKLRVAAAEALGKQTKRIPGARLFPLLQDKSEQVRSAVIKALAATEQNIPLETLLALLDDTEKVREAALNALKSTEITGEPEAALLLKMLTSPNETRRAATLYLLGEHATNEQLIAAMSDPHPQVRHDALFMVNKLHRRIPTSALLELLIQQGPRRYGEKDPVTRTEILDLLQQPEQPISYEELDAFARTKEMLENALCIANARQISLPVDLLLEALQQDYIIANAATHLLVEMKTNPPVASLLEIVQNGSTYTGLNAARALYDLSWYIQLEQEPILHQLQKLTANPRTSHHRREENAIHKMYNYLVLCLLRGGTSVPVECLLKALAANWQPHDNAKDEVLQAINRLGAQVPLIELLRIVSDSTTYRFNWGQGDRAIQALANASIWVTPETVQMMSQQERHTDEQIALKILGAAGKQAPVELLKSVLDDTSKDIYLRSEARLALHAAGIHLPLTYYLAETAIGHESPDRATIESMRELGPLAPLEELLQILTWTYDWTRVPFYLPECKEGGSLAHETAVEALRALVPYVPLEPVVAALEHSNAMVRAGAVRVLGAFGERAPIDTLIAFLEKHGALDATMETLAELHTYIPLEALAMLLSDYNKLMEWQQFWLLENWGRNLPLEPLLALAKNPEYNQRDLAIEALGWLQDRAPVDFLLALLESEDKDDVNRAARALSRMGKYTPLDALLALYHNNSEMREDMLDIFGAMGEYAPLAVILQALDDEDPHVRQAAEYALDEVAENAPARFVEATSDDHRRPVREALMKAIAHMGKDAPFEKAIAALYDEHADVRIWACRALLDLDINPDLVPIEPLLNALRERRSEHDSHWAELAMLARLGTRVPIEPLLALLGDSNPTTCESAAEALYQTHPEMIAEVTRQAGAILRGEPIGGVFASRTQGRVAGLVKRFGQATPEVLAMIVDLLDWPYWEVRVEAAQALETIHRNIPDRAIRRLLELRYDPESMEVRVAADAALAEIFARESGMEDE